MLITGVCLTGVCSFVLQELTVTDDTVLEEHSEDPSLVQIRLIGEGGEFLYDSFMIPLRLFWEER